MIGVPEANGLSGLDDLDAFMTLLGQPHGSRSSVFSGMVYGMS
jgi:hypothetical protein